MISTALSNMLLNKAFRGEDFTTFPVDVSLHTAEPGNVGASEVQNVDGSAYARQSSTFTLADLGHTENVSAVDFLDMPLVEVTHAAVWSGTTFLWAGPLNNDVHVDATRALRIPPGDLDISIT